MYGVYWTLFDKRRLPTADFLTKESSLVDEYTLNVDFRMALRRKTVIIKNCEIINKLLPLNIK
ncbi:hypothetical protein [Peribacillus butanolivorans]|uniref:hypothetical protein n=1 Tax=Peribacillus butanolivorans TaxID=421767 RepID=UPI00366D512F